MRTSSVYLLVTIPDSQSITISPRSIASDIDIYCPVVVSRNLPSSNASPALSLLSVVIVSSPFGRCSSATSNLSLRSWGLKVISISVGLMTGFTSSGGAFFPYLITPIYSNKMNCIV